MVIGGEYSINPSKGEQPLDKKLLTKRQRQEQAKAALDSKPVPTPAPKKIVPKRLSDLALTNPKRPPVVPDRTEREILKLKQQVLDLISRGDAKTLTECADLLQISPFEVHQWLIRDQTWADMVKIAKEVVADGLEDDLLASKNDIAKIFLLKGYRPQFRDNYRFIEIKDEATKTLLLELRNLGSRPPDNPTEPVPVAVKEVNPLAETIQRIRATDQAQQLALPLVEETNEVSKPNT